MGGSAAVAPAADFHPTAEEPRAQDTAGQRMSTYPSLAVLVQDIAKQINEYGSLSKVPAEAVGSAPAIAPLTERIARSLPRRVVPAAESGTSTG